MEGRRIAINDICDRVNAYVPYNNKNANKTNSIEEFKTVANDLLLIVIGLIRLIRLIRLIKILNNTINIIYKCRNRINNK